MELSKIGLLFFNRLKILHLIINLVLFSTKADGFFFGSSRNAACYGGANLTETEGRIRAPFLSTSNTDKKLCSWNIIAPKGQIIFFRFLSFNLGLGEPKTYCRSKSLRVKDGSRWLVFCGATPEVSGYVTSTNILQVELVHEGAASATSPSFVLQYKMITQSDVNSGNASSHRTIEEVRQATSTSSCRVTETVTLAYGATHTLQLTQSEYGNNCHRTWTITAPAKTMIELEVEKGKIEDGYMCAYDRLLVYGCLAHNCNNEPPGACNLLACLCGKITGRTLRSPGPMLKLEFISDGSITYSGFDIKLQVFETPEIIEQQEGRGNATCGISQLPRSMSRITGGTVVPVEGGIPWQAHLAYQGRHICGGAVLSNKWVITAAHCIYGLDDPTNLVVKVGDLKMGDGDERELEQRRFVKRSIVHCEYDPMTYDNDLALLEVKEPFRFTNQTYGICLPQDGDIRPGRHCDIAGWGKTSEVGELSKQLKYAGVHIISDKSCWEMFKQQGWGHLTLTHNQLCAAGNPKEGYLTDDACQGDSGGPLTLVTRFGEPTALYGIISWGIGCARPGLPGVYTRIYNYIHWINHVTKGDIYWFNP